MIDSAKYKDLFLSEARELLDSLDAGLLKLEKNPENSDLLQELMRYAHTLKGIAASQRLGEISNLAHSFEGMVENIKNHIGAANVDLLFGVVDELRGMVEKSVNENQEITANPLVDQVGELEKADQKSEQQILARPETFKAVNEVKVKTERLDKLVDLAAELVVNKMRLLSFAKDVHESFKEAVEDNADLIDELHYQILQLRLIPVDYEFNRFPRMVRDLAKQQDKEIELVIEGGEMELDRSIIDSIGEPLVHLLRNAVDHGIEKKGKITLTAKRDKDHAVISVSDNGLGIDWEKIKDKKSKINTSLSDEDFLFSGISTSAVVTEVSGRGVGLNIVKEKMESLGGSIEVKSKTGEGTVFLLRLPVSLAIIKALLITVGAHSFTIPISSIDRLIDLQDAEVQKQADVDVVIVDNEEVPLFSLADVLGIKVADHSLNQIALLIRFKKKLLGFTIDAASAQQDIIVKPLAEKIRNEGYFSSITLLGDGKPVPIIDVESIVKNIYTKGIHG